MEGDSRYSSDFINVPESNIRSIQLSIEAQLENFKRKIPDSTFLDSSVCDNVRDYVLNFDDEPHLSKSQNNWRRIFIASELFISICSLYSHIVDYEFQQIISDMIQWEKFKNLSRKISHRIQLESKREKYFLKEAQSKLWKTLEVPTDNIEEVPRPDKDIGSAPKSTVEIEQRSGKDLEQTLISLEDSERETVTRYEKELSLIPARGEITEDAGIETAAQAVDETLPPLSETSLKEDHIMSEIRAEPMADSTRLLYPISNIPGRDLSLVDTVTEISVVEPSIQQKTDDDINQILRFLEDQSFQKEKDEIEKPKILLEAIDKTTEVSKEASVEKLVTDKEADALESESEEWSLPSLEPTEKTRKRHPHLIIDEVTIIPEYAARALQLNRNVNIERVQVYEGPPKILQAISVNHLMTTPGFRNSFFRDTSDSKLYKFYRRHLKVQERPIEPELLQKRTVEKREKALSKKRTSTDTIEELATRAGMRSILEKTDVLIEAAPEKSHQEDLEISAFQIPPKESLVGMPMSRIISAAIEPPEEEKMERINGAVLLSPRAQRLQGKSLDPKTSSPSWFLYTKQNPPYEKYREFKYVYEKLQNYWSLSEGQGMEKCISLREFFYFEQNESKANFLLVLRIIDKMSIQRKLVLEYKDHDVLIRPFESPYVSDKQLLLKEQIPIF